MELGVVFPQGELEPTGAAALRFVAAAEDRGFDHLLAYDHVLGVDASGRPGWTGAHDLSDGFHEPLVLFAYVAGCTSLRFMTSVVVLPQRQTALVAKQAATLDLLSGGRLRLGVGIGWNEVEFGALGCDFATRGARFEEQVTLLRRLWTEPSVTHAGRFDAIDRAGVTPLPQQRPIPLWFGTFGRDRRPLERIGRLADGWMPSDSTAPDDALRSAKAVIDEAALAAGRDPASIGLEARIYARTPDEVSALGEHVAAWAELGATHLAVVTKGEGLDLDGHLRQLEAAADVLLR